MIFFDWIVVISISLTDISQKQQPIKPEMN